MIEKRSEQLLHPKEHHPRILYDQRSWRVGTRCNSPPPSLLCSNEFFFTRLENQHLRQRMVATDNKKVAPPNFRIVDSRAYVHNIHRRARVHPDLIHRDIFHLGILPVLYTGKQQQGFVQFSRHGPTWHISRPVAHLLFRHPFTQPASSTFPSRWQAVAPGNPFMRGILDELLCPSYAL